MTIETGKCQEASISHFFSSESILIRLVSGGCTSPVSIGSASPSSLLMTVVFSRLNSEMTLSPDRSENGKNFARKSKILPQKTVFWERDKRRSKSVENFEVFFRTLPFFSLTRRASLNWLLQKCWWNQSDFFNNKTLWTRNNSISSWCGNKTSKLSSFKNGRCVSTVKIWKQIVPGLESTARYPNAN